MDRRNEMADLDEDATDGQASDYIAAMESGDNGVWNQAVIEYHCWSCDLYFQVLEEELTSYVPLILAWHKKASTGDYFARFVFEYLAFIAHLQNNLFFDERMDRQVIQRLKRDDARRERYVERVRSHRPLFFTWRSVALELRRVPLHNSARDPDNPEIERWWNSSGREPNTDNGISKGVIHSPDDWGNMVEFWYGVRNNLFHGGKRPDIKRDLFMVEHAYKTLRAFMDIEIDRLRGA